MPGQFERLWSNAHASILQAEDRMIFVPIQIPDQSSKLTYD